MPGGQSIMSRNWVSDIGNQTPADACHLIGLLCVCRASRPCRTRMVVLHAQVAVCLSSSRHSYSALGAPGSVERRPPELTERSGRPSRHEPRAVRQVNRALLGISGSQGSRQWRPPFGADGAVSGPRVPRPMTDRAKENARGAAVMVGQAAAESAVRSDTESALLAPRARAIMPC